ncbi:nicotinate-nucleotide--dimethylbenzimidazole phosphoribosyltransferase [Streptomyces sp. NPDC058872]|uniref:nicotinate-nucleotide--dimethylbenzimidazole phosphoribosyltransferase n=1 Tax=Streptomyces sp. NPDC058872 TaxID=3346661 RepID=UPI0036A29DBB
MTDTGQVPGEGLPENAGMVEQPGIPAPGAYAFLDPSEHTAEDDDLLLMPGAQGAWSEQAPGTVPAPPVAVPAPPVTPVVPHQGVSHPAVPEAPAPQMAPVGDPLTDPLPAPLAGPAPDAVPLADVLTAPQVQTPPQGVPLGTPAHGVPVPPQEPVRTDHGYEPGILDTGAHEAAGRDSGSVDLGGVRMPPPAAAPTPARRPLHMGPPVPEATGGVVRSLADRGPATAHVQVPQPAPAPEPAVATAPAPVPMRNPGPPTTGPEYFEIAQDQQLAPQGAEPWGVQPQETVPTAETVVPQPTPSGQVEEVAPQPAPGPTEEAPVQPPAAEVVELAAAPQGAPEPMPVTEEPAPTGAAVPAPREGEPVAPAPTGAPTADPVALTVDPVAPGTDPVAPGAEVPAAPVVDASTTAQVVEAESQAPEAPTAELPEPAPVVEAPAPVVEGPVPATEAPAPVAVPAVEVPAAETEPPAPATAMAASAAEPAAPTTPAAEPVADAEGEPVAEADAEATPEQPAESLPQATVQVPTDAPTAASVQPGTEAPAEVQAEVPVEVTADEIPVVAEDAPAEAGPEAPVEQGPEAEAAPVAAEAAEPVAPASSEEPRPTTPAPGYDEAEREAVLRVMRERRDIRNGFRSDPIPHEVLLRVLEAAHTAPSVGHSQPWDFVVIRSADTRQAMHQLAQRQREAYAKSLPKARAKQFKELKIEAILDTPVNIVVTADSTRGGRHTLGRYTQPQMAPYSSALAVENLWLAARAEGLGVGWVSFFDEREMVRALGLPEHLEVVAYLCVGYVDEFPEEPELMQAGWSKRRPLAWVVHEETYGRRALPGEEPHDLLQETVANIRPLDAKALGEAWERQKRMTKPAGALGMLEIISAQLSGLSRVCPPPVPEPAAVAIFAGDHGVHAQGVTPWPQEVTGQMVANFLGGGAVCNAFANQVGAEVCVVDVGVAAELPATPGLLPRKVRQGTGDFTTGPAMTREEVLAAIEVGIETARDLVAAGNKALLTGEMGIANTTASAALISVYTGVDAAEVTGRGTGINDETHARKVDVVRRALALHEPDPADPIGVLSAIGGLEHAALVGLILGAASLRTPVILDGVSTGAAALVARAIAPESLAACIAGHRSAEPGHVAALNKLGLRPLVDLDLRLGEGTGALLALPLVQSAARAMHEVATFDSAGVTEK